MKTQKITVSITAEMLSIDTLKSLLTSMYNFGIEKEAYTGNFEYDDGDSISWVTVKKSVNF